MDYHLLLKNEERNDQRRNDQNCHSPPPSPLISASSSGQISPLISGSPIPDQLCDFDG